MAGIRKEPEERLLDLDQIAEMAIFAIDLQRPRVVFLDGVRLDDSVSGPLPSPHPQAGRECSPLSRLPARGQI